MCRTSKTEGLHHQGEITLFGRKLSGCADAADLATWNFAVLAVALLMCGTELAVCAATVLCYATCSRPVVTTL
jgi:hypothetical protein